MADAADELAVARIAAAQHGIVTVHQLHEAGFGPRAILRRVAGGWLVRLHEGVYQVGVFGGPFAPEMAALLACGSRSAVGHDSSIAVFGLGARPSGVVHVAVPATSSCRRRGIVSHRTFLAPADVVVRHGLRVTTPARTLFDLAASTPLGELERLTEEVQVQKLASRAELLAVLARGAGRPGVTKLRAVVGPDDEPTFTRSEAERRLRWLIRAAGLPSPRMNVRLKGWLVDAVWHEQRLVVEVDGYQYHRTRPKFERDRRKDGQLLMAGYRVLRVTWRQITREPERVIAMIAGALAA